MKRVMLIALPSALGCLLLGAIAYRRIPPKAEDSPIDRDAGFFSFLDSVTVQSPTLTTVSTTRSRRREVSETLSARGCQCYGSEVRTIKSADGLQLQLATSFFAITSARLRENQFSHFPIHPISDPWFELNEMFIDGKLVRAIEDKELRIDLGNATVPVLYAKWQDPRGNFTNIYTAWSIGQMWMIPFDRIANEGCRIPNLLPQQIQDGIELIRIDIRFATDHVHDEVPVELIRQVLEPFSDKILAN